MAEEHHTTGVVDAVTTVANGLISALPPAFVMLVLLNVGFLSVVLWFVNNQITQRLALFDRVLTECLKLHGSQ